VQSRRTTPKLDSLRLALAGIGGAYALKRIGETVIELGNLGAQAERAEVSLVNLSGGAEEAQAYIDAVGRASHNTIAEIDAMQASITAQTLGVVNSADEMERLTRLAITLGQAQGFTATQSIDKMTTALGRQSTRILDDLGIMMKQNEAYEIYADMLGKTADELTDAEKQQAFLNAALEKGAVVAAERVRGEDVAAVAGEPDRPLVRCTAVQCVAASSPAV